MCEERKDFGEIEVWTCEEREKTKGLVGKVLEKKDFEERKENEVADHLSRIEEPVGALLIRDNVPD